MKTRPSRENKIDVVGGNSCKVFWRETRRDCYFYRIFLDNVLKIYLEFLGRLFVLKKKDLTTKK